MSQKIYSFSIMYKILVSVILFSSLAYAESAFVISNDSQNVEVQYKHSDELFSGCINSGFELKYRYEIQICKKRGSWFDSCLTSKIGYNSVMFDSLSGTYTLKADRLRDGNPPITEKTDSHDDAVLFINTISKLPLKFLAEEDTDYLKSKHSYISVKLSSECHGEYDETISRISSFLSLGFLKINGFETTWQDHPLSIK